MNNELLEALNILEQEKNISKETLLEAIENSLLTACKNHFGKADNVKVVIDPETCEYHCFQEKTVVEEVEDPIEQISLVNAQMINRKYELGDVVQVEVGALMVGKIKNHHGKGKVTRGGEKGMFLFGGSTIILLLNSNEVLVEEEFFENTKNHLETVIKLGEPLGRKRK